MWFGMLESDHDLEQVNAQNVTGDLQVASRR